MIKKYLAHLHTKSAHDRRQHAMRAAASFTAFAAFVWVTTLGVRFALTPQQLAQNNADAAQTASVVDSQQGNATLIVATTTDSGSAQNQNNYFNNL